MEQRRKITKYILYVVIIFSIFGLSYIITRSYLTSKNTVTSVLPLTGEEETPKQMDWDIDKVKEEIPWGASNKENITLPSNYALEKSFRDFIESINTRNYDLFSNVVSKKFKWEFENNRVYYNKNVDDRETIFIQGNIFGEKYFKNYSPILLDFNLPNNKELYQIVSHENITLNPTEPYYFIDNQKQEIYHIKTERIPFARRAYFKINSDLIKQSDVDGYVDFVFEDNNWKITDYDWKTAYIPNVEIKDISAQNIKSDAFIHETSINDLMDGISVKYGDIVKIDNISGMIFSKYEENKTLWNSNKIIDGSYEIYITDSIATSFIFKNIDGVYFEGIINIVP